MREGNYAPVTVHKNEAVRNKFPKELNPETEDCECKTYSVEAEEGMFGCCVPRRLTNIAELFSDHFYYV